MAFRNRQWLWLSAACVALSLGACTPKPQPHAGQAVPVGKLPDLVTPNSYALDLTIDPAQANFQGKVAIDLTFKSEASGFWIHGKELNVKEAYVEANGAKIAATYTQMGDNGIAWVALASKVPAGAAKFVATYETAFSDQALEGIYRGDGEDKIYVASQMESISARRMMPSFDEPRFKTPFNISVTAPKGQVVITNTSETSATDIDATHTRHVFAATQPLPTYLLAFAVGPYDVVEWPGGIAPNALRKEPIPLRGVAAAGKGSQLQVALSETGKIVDYQENYFAVPYNYGKLDLVASPAFAYGAMENAGAIFYRETRLLVPTNASFAQRRAYLGTHAHELAHQWFGDYVTPVWWEDIWLNEAFASWFGNKTAAATFPEMEFARDTLDDALNAMQIDSLSSTRQIMNPVNRDEEIDDVFDAITYQKGGGVLAMFERFMGPDKFREGVRLHMRNYGNKVATSDQFFQSMADGSGQKEAADAFRTFVTQKFVPLVSTTLDCKDPKAPKLTLTQSVYKAIASPITAQQSWKIPACVSYPGKKGVQETCALVDKPSVTIALDADACPTFYMPNAAGAGYYRFTMDDAAWGRLIDNFARLPAAEQLVVLDSSNAAFQAGTASANVWLRAIEAGAKAPDWDVAQRALNQFLGRSTRILDGTDDALTRSQLVRIFGNRAATLMSAKTLKPGDRLLRAALAEALVVDAQDPAYIGALSKEAKIGDLSFMQRESDIRVAIAASAVLANGGQVPEALLTNVLASKDQGLRADALRGIASSVSAEGAKTLFAAVSSGKVPGTDLQTLMGGLAGNSNSRAATYAWVKANIATLVPFIPQARRNSLPNVVNSFCDVDMANEADSFFSKGAVDKDGKSLIPGFERNLSQSTESVRLCAGLKSARAEELRTAFKRG